MATADSIFVADPDGWRSQNLDRPPQHLVRELVQNALDEAGVTKLDVLVTYHGSRLGTTVVVVDNAPQGVKDERHLFTIFLSDKEDSPLKRGRMGRGLKEIISVANKTTIRSMNIDALQFERKQGGEWSRRTLPKYGRTEVGTEVTCFCRAWGKPAAKGIVDFIKRVRAPKNIALNLAFQDLSETDKSIPPVYAQVVPFEAAETYALSLPTVIYEVDDGDRKARDRTRDTTVECFSPPPGEKAFIYELGIPVEEAPSSPVSMDVQQRVILRERRDTVTDSYRRQLFARVLDARVKAGRITEPSELRSNVALQAAASPYDLSMETRKLIAQAWTGGLPYATSGEEFARATGQHVEAVQLRTLPEAVRDLLKYNGAGVSVKDVLEARKGELCPPLKLEEMAQEMVRFVTFFEYLSAAIKRPCKVTMNKGDPGFTATFDRDTQTMAFYVGPVVKGYGKKYFEDPSAPEPLRTFIHEMAHWKPKEHEHGTEFFADSEAVGGLVASFLLRNAEQVRLHLNAAVTP